MTTDSPVSSTLRRVSFGRGSPLGRSPTLMHNVGGLREATVKKP